MLAQNSYLKTILTLATLQLSFILKPAVCARKDQSAVKSKVSAYMYKYNFNRCKLQQLNCKEQ